MEELTNKIIKLNEKRDWDQFHLPENLAKNISIESLEYFQLNNEFNTNEVKEELANVINYCLLLVDKIKLNSEQIVLDKMKKTAKNILWKNLKRKAQNIINYR